MGRNKDTTHQLPVDHYRKEIGKQDYKKSKAELKDTKLKAQAKKGSGETYKEISIMVGALVAVIGFVYALLYMMLEKRN